MADETENTEGGQEEFSISPEEWAEAQETIALIREAMSQPEPQPEPEPQQGPRVPDPFSETYAQDLEAYVVAKNQEATAPFQGFTEEARMAEAEERAMDIIDSFKADKGDLPEGGAQIVRSLANEYIGEAVERHGQGPQAAEAALAKAYDTFQALRESDNKTYYESRMNELASLGKAPKEPPANNTGASQGLERSKGDELSIVRGLFQGQ